MDKKMPWLKTRLRTVNKTPAMLARHLGIAAPRVYEMIGGRRALQPSEMRQTAEYLDWSIEELASHLPAEARIVPMQEHALLPSSRNGITFLASTEATGTNYDAVLTGDTTRHVMSTLEGRSDVFCLYLHGNRMTPWRKPGELVLFEKGRPAAENDHVVIWMTIDDQATVTIRQLMTSKHPGKVKLRQHNPGKDVEIDRTKVTSIFRVMTWDDVIR